MPTTILMKEPLKEPKKPALKAFLEPLKEPQEPILKAFFTRTPLN